MIFATASLYHAYLMCLDQESWDRQILFKVEMYLQKVCIIVLRGWIKLDSGSLQTTVIIIKTMGLVRSFYYIYLFQM